ncbi:tetratricopeptide repeat protein [Parendozoicomonas haliclonae]
MTSVTPTSPETETSGNAEQLFYQGVEKLSQNLLDEAQVALESSYKLNPSNSGTPFNLAICYVRKGMYQAALEFFEKTIELEPELTVAYFNAGKTAFLMGSHEEAVIYFERSLKGDMPEGQVLPAKGIALHSCGRMAEALEDFNRALELEESTVCLLYRAKSKMMMHDFAGALTDIERLEELGEVNAETLVVRFMSLKQMQRNWEALEAFEQLEAIDPEAGKQFSISLAEDLEEARKNINLIVKH